MPTKKEPKAAAAAAETETETETATPAAAETATPAAAETATSAAAQTAASADADAVQCAYSGKSVPAAKVVRGHNGTPYASVNNKTLNECGGGVSAFGTDDSLIDVCPGMNPLFCQPPSKRDPEKNPGRAQARGKAGEKARNGVFQQISMSGFAKTSSSVAGLTRGLTQPEALLLRAQLVEVWAEDTTPEACKATSAKMVTVWGVNPAVAPKTPMCNQFPRGLKPHSNDPREDAAVHERYYATFSRKQLYFLRKLVFIRFLSQAVSRRSMPAGGQLSINEKKDLSLPALMKRMAFYNSKGVLKACFAPPEGGADKAYDKTLRAIAEDFAKVHANLHSLQRSSEADMEINRVAAKYSLTFLHNPECKRQKQIRDHVQASMTTVTAWLAASSDSQAKQLTSLVERLAGDGVITDAQKEEVLPVTQKTFSRKRQQIADFVQQKDTKRAREDVSRLDKLLSS